MELRADDCAEPVRCGIGGCGVEEVEVQADGGGSAERDEWV